MSELLDKQVNVQNESLFRGSRKLLQAHEKVCDENERKNNYSIKIFVVKGRTVSED